MVKPSKAKQQTLEATLGRPRVRPATKTPMAKGNGKRKVPGDDASSSPPIRNLRGAKSSPIAPPSSFLASSQINGSAKKRRLVREDSSSSSDSDRDEDAVKLPVRGEKSGTSRLASRPSLNKRSAPRISRGGGDVDDDDDDDDDPLVTPKSAKQSSRKRVIALDDEDEDDVPLRSSPIKRRRLVRKNDASSPAKDRDSLFDGSESDDKPAQTPSSSRVRRKTGRKLRSAKERARELLRRKRAGESIDELEETSSSEGKPIYDTDSDHPALSDFEDDEEGVEVTKRKGKKSEQPVDDESSISTDDFVVNDSDEPLGVPDDVYLDMPLHFTAHSHKPLREHFRDVVEWLVQLKINPGFSEKGHELYRMGWRKLDDEVRGLAQSKFESAVWKLDFTKALRARPYFTSQELGKNDVGDLRTCGACGRSNHPAKWVIQFSGTPYFKDPSKDTFLDPVEANSDSDSSLDYDEDEDGNEIPRQNRQWFVGVVCCANAETAHTLIHWKHALLDWVDSRLHDDGYMTPEKLVERERMRPKQKYKLVDEILKQWVDAGVVRALYQEFKASIEKARIKSTAGRYNR